jgi:DnaK suppressor protein
VEKEDQVTFRPFIYLRLAAIEEELIGLIDDTAAIAPDVSIGRLSRLDSMQQQQMALANKRRLEDERNRLFESQRRIDTGSYGHCLICHADISRERLEYQPEAITCVPCAQKR